MDFYTVLNSHPYTVNTANNTGSIKCSRESFEGTNPIPGEEKECFCDEHTKTLSATDIFHVKEYWRSELQAMRLREVRL